MAPAQSKKKTTSTFNWQQQQLFDLYKNYIENLEEPEYSPPPILLLHGKAGTGKTTVLNAILDYAKFCSISTTRLAFNGINALHIKGEKVSSLLYRNSLLCVTVDQLQDFKPVLNTSKLIVVDKLSSQAPKHLANLNFICQQIKGNNLSFGGIPKCS